MPQSSILGPQSPCHTAHDAPPSRICCLTLRCATSKVLIAGQNGLRASRLTFASPLPFACAQGGRGGQGEKGTPSLCKVACDSFVRHGNAEFELQIAFGTGANLVRAKGWLAAARISAERSAAARCWATPAPHSGVFHSLSLRSFSRAARSSSSVTTFPLLSRCTCRRTNHGNRRIQMPFSKPRCEPSYSSATLLNTRSIQAHVLTCSHDLSQQSAAMRRCPEGPACVGQVKTRSAFVSRK